MNAVTLPASLAFSAPQKAGSAGAILTDSFDQSSWSSFPIVFFFSFRLKEVIADYEGSLVSASSFFLASPR